MKTFYNFLVLILLCLNGLISSAQQNDTLEIQRDDKGVVKFARFSQKSEWRVQRDTAFLKSVLHAKPEDSFQLISELISSNGGIDRKFQQYFRGIKVENAEYLIHGRDGFIESINGDFQKVKISSLSASINQETALKSALDYVNSKKYKWQDESYELFIKKQSNNLNATYYPKGELVIAKDYLAGAKNFRLAWKFTISSLVPDNEQWIFVDAITDLIIGNTPLIKDANATGLAQTRYSQNVGIICDSYTDGYRLFETRNTTSGNSVGVHTLDCRSSYVLTNAYEINNTNTNWINGSWPGIVTHQAGLDAHWGQERVLDYWSHARNRNSLNNQGIAINGYVHFYDPARTDLWPNNAAWDPVSNVMKYGDGDGLIFTPVVALDVVAHEMGHGINQFTANLHSLSGSEESDALNEGFSDIWGATIELWAAPNKQTWRMGEDIVALLPFNCIRDLSFPNSLNALEGQHPDTWHGSFWDFNGNAHTNSTVLSHWFYLLSQGGSGWNNGLTSHAPQNNGYPWSVIGIGMHDASRIAYITESRKLFSSSQYSDVRNASISAAVDSFGVNSCQVINTTNAWYAVGVGGKFQYSGITISAPTNNLICSSGTFTVNGMPSGCVISQWKYSSNLTLSSAIGNSATFTTSPNSNSAGWVQPIIHSNSCGTDTEVPVYNVWCGTPQITNQKVDGGYYSPGMQICPGNHYLTVTPIGGNVSNATWTVPGGVPYSVGTNLLNFTFPSSYSSIAITCRSTNTCGVGTNASFYLSKKAYGCSGFFGMTVYPNPASDNVTITLDNMTTSNTIDESDLSNVDGSNSVNITPVDYTINIYNNQSMRLSSFKRTGNSFNIPLVNMRDGTYIIEVTDGKNSYKQQLIVKRN
jgi:Zn-dependent metalloprotease